MDSNSPNDYYTIGKLICYRCPVWEECLQSASNEVWGMWGGITPQERKGTSRPLHGSVELFRMGCACSDCADAGDKVHTPIDLALLPVSGEKFDTKDLLYKLIGS